MARQTKRQRRESNEQAAAQFQADAAARQDHALANSNKRIHVSAKTENQAIFIDAIKNHEVSAAIGPAGVGKTFIAASVAADMLMRGDVDKIILTRANVTVGRSIGALPGTVEDKMTPLLLPILNVIKRQLGDALYEYCMRKRKIEMLPVEYVRGMSFLKTFVLIDEAQNLTSEEVKALVTRYESGRIVFMGDPHQHDLVKTEPGIQWLEHFSKRHQLGLPVVRFSMDDIVRSALVKKFIMALDADSKGQLNK